MIINTNVASLLGLNNLRQTDGGLRAQLEKLSSGLRINKAADDPSGLAIAMGMSAQIRGMNVATQNAEDAKNLIHTADGTLGETTDILLRMRDLAVRASNEATLTTADARRLNDEFVSLRDEVGRKAKTVSFNNKLLFSGFGSQYVQIAPNKGSNYILKISLPNVGLGSLRLSGFRIASNATAVQNMNMARSGINYVQSALNKVAAVRANLGVQERRIDHIIDDMAAMQINISAAKSRIMDAEMGSEIAEFTRLQILQQSGTAVLAQANMSPAGILQLLR